MWTPGLLQILANAKPERGRVKAQEVCVACHGEQGVSAAPENPHLAGQSGAAIYKPNGSGEPIFIDAVNRANPTPHRQSQTRGGPAAQADLHYQTSAGWFAGVWASTVNLNHGPGATVELDAYAGRAWPLSGLRRVNRPLLAFS